MCVSWLSDPFGKKGWQLFDLETREYFVSRDVKFHERVFPYSEEYESTLAAQGRVTDGEYDEFEHWQVGGVPSAEASDQAVATHEPQMQDSGQSGSRAEATHEQAVTTHESQTQDNGQFGSQAVAMHEPQTQDSGLSVGDAEPSAGEHEPQGQSGESTSES